MPPRTPRSSSRPTSPRPSCSVCTSSGRCTPATGGSTSSCTRWISRRACAWSSPRRWRPPWSRRGAPCRFVLLEVSSKHRVTTFHAFRRRVGSEREMRDESVVIPYHGLFLSGESGQSGHLSALPVVGSYDTLGPLSRGFVLVGYYLGIETTT